MQTLKNLIHPYSVDQFLSENWTQKGIIIPGEQFNKFHSLFSWQQLNYLLNFHKLRFPEDIRFASTGKKIVSATSTPREWIEQCQEGHTLIVNQLHKMVPALAEFTSAIQQEMGHRAQINMYCSWPAQQGFDLHYDGHEVFILQIDGHKKWFIYEDTFKFPLEKDSQTFTKHNCPDSSPYIEAVLNPGDILYIPRGHWHYAIACDKPSLHLTLGITCRTGIDWLNWLVEELDDQIEWRQNLPLVKNSDTSQLICHIQGLLQKLTTLIGDKKIIRNYVANHITTTGTRHPELSLPSQSGFCLFSKKEDTLLRHVKFQPVRVDYHPELNQYEILTQNKKITLEDAPLKLVENLFNRETFMMKEVAEWVPEFDLEEDIVPLIWSLIKEGILLVDN